jgi:hypothetical protein
MLDYLADFQAGLMNILPYGMFDYALKLPFPEGVLMDLFEA